MSTSTTQMSKTDVNIRNTEKQQKIYETNVDIHNTIF